MSCSSWSICCRWRGVGSVQRSRIPSSVQRRSATLSSMSEMPSGELGFAKVGKGRTHPVEREPGALLGDADGLAKTFLASPPSLGHLLRRKETPLAVRMQQPARGGVVDREFVAQRGEHVVDETSRLVHVARILRGEPRETFLFGELDELIARAASWPPVWWKLDFYR